MHWPSSTMWLYQRRPPILHVVLTYLWPDMSRQTFLRTVGVTHKVHGVPTVRRALASLRKYGLGVNITPYWLPALCTDLGAQYGPRSSWSHLQPWHRYANAQLYSNEIERLLSRARSNGTPLLTFASRMTQESNTVSFQLANSQLRIGKCYTDTCRQPLPTTDGHSVICSTSCPECQSTNLCTVISLYRALRLMMFLNAECGGYIMHISCRGDVLGSPAMQNIDHLRR